LSASGLIYQVVHLTALLQVRPGDREALAALAEVAQLEKR
jgi:hypothetical protein